MGVPFVHPFNIFSSEDQLVRGSTILLGKNKIFKYKMCRTFGIKYLPVWSLFHSFVINTLAWKELMASDGFRFPNWEVPSSTTGTTSTLPPAAPYSISSTGLVHHACGSLCAPT